MKGNVSHICFENETGSGAKKRDHWLKIKWITGNWFLGKRVLQFSRLKKFP